MFAHSQRFEPPVIKSEILNKIFADNDCSRLGEQQLFLCVSLRAGGDNHNCDAELILREELSTSIERFLVFQLG